MCYDEPWQRNLRRPEDEFGDPPSEITRSCPDPSPLDLIVPAATGKTARRAAAHSGSGLGRRQDLCEDRVARSNEGLRGSGESACVRHLAGDAAGARVLPAGQNLSRSRRVAARGSLPKEIASG